MSSLYTVESCEPGNTFTTEHGQFQVWKLAITDGNQQLDAELNTKVGNDGPSIGERIEGTLTKGQYGWKLKKVQQQNGGGGGGGYKEDPKRQATIIRQHSQHMALLHVEGIERRFVPSEGKPRFALTPDALRKIINFFDEDAKQAGEKAS